MFKSLKATGNIATRFLKQQRFMSSVSNVETPTPTPSEPTNSVSRIIDPKRLYISNLPFTVRPIDLKSLMSNFGYVTEAKIAQDRATGRSRGFGFVTFADERCAEAAREKMDQSLYWGKPLRVSPATTMTVKEVLAGKKVPDGFTPVTPTPTTSESNSQVQADAPVKTETEEVKATA